MGILVIMKALIVEHRGEQGSLRSVTDPIPSDNELVIRVIAAGINPVDWKLRDLYDRPRPFTLGQDFAGIVVGVGGKVTTYHYGDRVFGIARQHGSYAELTVCPVNDAAQPISHIPDTVGDSDAAAVPTPGLTAMACFEHLHLAADAHIAIIGASGSVGQIAVQLARNAGLQVTGVGGAHSEAAIRALGAANYVAHDTHSRDGLLAALRHLAPGGFAAVLDFASDAATITSFAQIVKPQGILLSTNHSINAPDFDRSALNAINVNLDGSRAASHEGLRSLGKLLESGSVRAPEITERSFGDALQALELVKTGKLTGKVIVTFP